MISNVVTVAAISLLMLLVFVAGWLFIYQHHPSNDEKTMLINRYMISGNKLRGQFLRAMQGRSSPSLPASYTASLAEYHQQIPSVSYARHDNSNDRPNTSVPLFKLGVLLENWPSDDVSDRKWSQSVAHPHRKQNIPRFDFRNSEDVRQAYHFRSVEQPFIVYNVPELNEAAERQFSRNELLGRMGTAPLHVERSDSNKFMYYTSSKVSPEQLQKKGLQGWRPPQQETEMSFADFVQHAVQAENTTSSRIDTARALHYLTISTFDRQKEYGWIYDALSFFQPRQSLFMMDTSRFRGIVCRFGMRGVTAAAHFDGKRNFVAVIRGRRRFVLLPPSECKSLRLYPRWHPSSRHSAANWSNIEEIRHMHRMYNAKATEVVLSMGEMLYIPCFWFHYIISQDASIQCNARSGDSDIGRDEIARCGFIKDANS